MHATEAGRRGVVYLGVFALVVTGCAERSGAARQPADPVVTLRAGFAVHAPRVLGEASRTRFVAARERGGFVAAPVATGDRAAATSAALAGHEGLRVTLPRRGHEAIRFGFADGFGVAVTEVGLAGAGRLAGGAVVYDRGAGEASFWSATDEGYEEWLLLRPAAAGTLATWELRGGTPRQRGATVEVLDAQGQPRLVVTAPAAYASDGRPTPVRLAAAGSRVVLTLAGDEARARQGLVLVDPLWQATGGMGAGRTRHSATLLPSGKVLIAGGQGFGVTHASARIYDPATGSFAATGSLATARYDHTATLLASGKVLVVGGRGGSNEAFSSAEVYDPATGSFTPTVGNLAGSRYFHTATLLASGKVLVVGGWLRASAELYDPATGTFTATSGSLMGERFSHTATRLPNDTVLIAGGTSFLGGATTTAELYQPATGTFTLTNGALTTARLAHTATLLPNGRVLVAGGSGSSTPLSSAELFDPAAGSFTATVGGLWTPRSGHSATLLPSGQVLVAAGSSGSGVHLGSAELFDPATGKFTPTNTLLVLRSNHTATLLPDGRVLVAGGQNASVPYYLGSVELFDPTAGGSFAATGALATGRASHTATLLRSGKVLLAGGDDGITASYRSSAELYDPTTGTVAPTTGPLGTARSGHSATLLASGQVLLAGGGNAGVLASAELYDPSAGTFALTSGPLATARRGHTGTLLPSGQVLIVGGTDLGASLASAELYSPASATFALSAGALGVGRQGHSATLLASGKVLVAGGEAGGVAHATAELYDPVSDAFVATAGSLATARSRHSATLLASGKVLLAGGRGGGEPLASLELYDPASDTFAALSGALATGRERHSATLLPSGKVLLAGGLDASGRVGSVDLYDPATGAVTPVAGALTQPRENHSATLLLSGKVLVAGGGTAGGYTSTELYDDGRAAQPGWAPTLGGPLPAVVPGAPLALSGALLTGLGEASSGATRTSATNFPLVLLRRQDNAALLFAPTSAWSATSVTSDVPLVAIPGPYQVWIAANGILSPGQPLTVTAQTIGGACALGAGCANGFCVDGVCCATACTATCQACSAATTGGGADGACGHAAPDTDPRQQCAGGLTCDGAGACRSHCTTDAQCEAGYYCTAAASGRCEPKLATGTGCGADPLDASGDHQCATGFCADAVCCNTDCGGACFACSAAKQGSGSDGTCAPVAANSDPDAECPGALTCDGAGACRTACTGDAQCEGGHYCTAATGGSCAAIKDPGAPCAADTIDATGQHQCASTYCVDGFCCATDCAATCAACSAVKQGAGSDGACGNVAPNTDPDAECAGGLTCDGAGACRSACTADAQCEAGYYCTNTAGGSCVAQRATGAPCAGDPVDASGGHQCALARCVDGVCCDEECAGTCRACTAAKRGSGSDGACGDVAPSTDPDGECAGGLTCDGAGACRGGCSVDAECEAAHYCTSAAGGACAPRSGSGAPCAADTIDGTGGHQCTSGFCADGVCCNEACTAPCRACNQGPTTGLCANLPRLAEDPVATTPCGGQYACDGAGVCKLAIGQLCAAGQCASGQCVDGVCCESACTATCKTCNLAGNAGACVNLPRGAEDLAAAGLCTNGYVCDGQAGCKLATGRGCAQDDECATGFCSDGVCCDARCDAPCYTCGASGVCGVVAFGQPDATSAAGACSVTHGCDGQGACKLAQGQACTATNQCLSGNCVDGVCCDSQCAGKCQACNRVGAVGQCSYAPADSDPDGDCGAGACKGACDGAGGCTYPGPTLQCAPADCTDGAARAAAFCDGSGACAPATPQSCGAYQCAASQAQCLTSCGQDSDCREGNYCDDGGRCLPTLADGTICARGPQCAHGVCVDGVCCDQACDSPCHSCALDDARGTCTPAADGADPRRECQAATGGSAACAGSCQSGQCAFPDVGTWCGQCAACDGTGRCTEVPADDDGCGVIDCTGLATACRAYQSLTASRCAALGVCKTANDPATCTQYTDLQCLDGSTPALDAGVASGGTSSGCRAAPAERGPGSGLLVVVALLLGLARPRRGR